MVELGLGAVADGTLRGIRHILLGIPDRLRKPAGVELDQVDGRLGKDREPRGADTGKTAADEVALMLAPRETDVEQARAKRGKKRRVMRKHGHVALGARQQHLLDLSAYKP